jgi:hypothetical protein
MPWTLHPPCYVCNNEIRGEEPKVCELCRHWMHYSCSKYEICLKCYETLTDDVKQFAKKTYHKQWKIGISICSWFILAFIIFNYVWTIDDFFWIFFCGVLLLMCYSMYTHQQLVNARAESKKVPYANYIDSETDGENEEDSVDE